MKTLVLRVALITLLAGYAFAAGQPDADTTGDIFVVGNDAEPDALDPHLVTAAAEHRIVLGLFEGLVMPDPETATAVPGIAESWEISDDGTVYTFILRDDALWSDGNAITAQHVVDSWIRVLNPETAAPYAWFPAMFIKGAAAYNGGSAPASQVAVRALSERQFQFETVGPIPFTVDALAHFSFAVVPLHVIEAHGPAWTLPENFVGNGPFTLAEWEARERIVLEPSPTYWNADTVELTRVVFLPVEDGVTRFNMYVNGEIDWATTVPSSRIDSAQPGGDIQSHASLGTYFYSFNHDREPLNDSRVRTALALAVDRELLIETVTRAGQLPAYGLVPPMAGYPASDGVGESVAEAQALLAEAGYPGGDGFPELKLLFNATAGHQSIAEFVRQQWLDNLGVSVALDAQEWEAYLLARRSGTFDIARAGWVGSYADPSAFLELFVTGRETNDLSFASDAYDRLLAQAAAMPAGVPRFETLAEAERILIEEQMVLLPLYHYVHLDMIDREAWGGWYGNVLGWHPVGAVFGR